MSIEGDYGIQFYEHQIMTDLKLLRRGQNGKQYKRKEDKASKTAQSFIATIRGLDWIPQRQHGFVYFCHDMGRILL